MSDYQTWKSIRAVTPTICELFGINYPSLCDIEPLGEVIQVAKKVFHGKNAEKCLVYAPDAIGNHLFKHSPTLFDPVVKAAPTEVLLQSINPSITPVCFASMFTGARPVQHGIERFEKPVLKCDTLFDECIKAEKRIAIVAVKDQTMDLIFRGRDMDYFSEEYDPSVTQRVISLLVANQHDFIVAYHQEYDDTMHKTTPFDKKAILAAKNNITAFTKIAKAFNRYWGTYNRVIVFTPDHGAHVNPSDGKGTHGKDIPEDMEIKHFYGFYPGIKMSV